MYDVNETGCIWLILNWKVKILKTLKWNDLFTIKTWSRKLEKFYGYRDFEVYDANNKLVCIASSKWVYLDINNGKFAKPTEEKINKYGQVDKMVFDDEIEKIKELENMETRYTYTILERNIDVNNHVNNSYYIDFALQALEGKVDVKEMQVSYKKECKLGETVECMLSSDNNKRVVVIRNYDTKVVNAIVELYI